jgi:hypothetical protein
LPPNACSRVYTDWSLRSTVTCMTFAPTSTMATFLSLPLRAATDHDRQRGLLRERFDVHDKRLQSRGLGDRDAVLDLFLARRRDHHFLLVGAGGRRTDHLEIEVHFLEREGDVLVGFGLDLDLERVLAQGGVDDDLPW